MAARMFAKLWMLIVLALASAVVPVATPAWAYGDQPHGDKHPVSARGEQCVEPTDFMRRNHMELLKHQRNETMHLGIRTTRHSLKGCVACHASAKTGSVAADKEDFCVSCHAYAAVHLDCWDCHATKPGKKMKVPVAAMPVSPIGKTLKGGSQ